MSLTPFFTEEAEDLGPYRATLSFEPGPFNDGVDTAKTVFRNIAPKACYELGIQIGVNETETGFEIGCETSEDYHALMDVLEPRMMDGVNGSYRRTAALFREHEKESGLPAARVNPFDPEQTEELTTDQAKEKPILTPREQAIADQYLVRRDNAARGSKRPSDDAERHRFHRFQEYER